MLEDQANNHATNVPGSLPEHKLADGSNGALSAKRQTQLSQSDDARRFTEYYLEARPSLRAYLYTLLRNHSAVEDCLQEACIVVWDKKQPDWTLEDFRKVAFTCARFKALSWLKKHKPASHLTLSPELSSLIAKKSAQIEFHQDTGLQERMEAMRLCIGALPEKQQRILNTRYGAADSSKTTLSRLADSLNSSLPAIYKQLERMRTALKDCISKRLAQ